MNIDFMFVKLRGVGALLLVNPVFTRVPSKFVIATDGVSEQYIERGLAVISYPETIMEILRFSPLIRK